MGTRGLECRVNLSKSNRTETIIIMQKWTNGQWDSEQWQIMRAKYENNEGEYSSLSFCCLLGCWSVCENWERRKTRQFHSWCSQTHTAIMFAQPSFMSNVPVVQTSLSISMFMSMSMRTWASTMNMDKRAWWKVIDHSYCRGKTKSRVDDWESSIDRESTCREYKQSETIHLIAPWPRKCPSSFVVPLCLCEISISPLFLPSLCDVPKRHTTGQTLANACITSIQADVSPCFDPFPLCLCILLVHLSSLIPLVQAL